MISPQIENLVRMKVQQSNVMLASQPQPGQVPGRAEGGSAPGIIPGPVSMMGGDNTMTSTKSGEYILPVEAVMGLGVRMGATTHGDALAIGKHILDKEVMGLKKEMGNNTPPRNSGISTGADQASPTPGQGVGFAEGGIISDATQWLGSHVVDPLKNMMTPKPGIPVGSTPPLQPQQVGSGYLNRTGTGLQSHNSAVEQVARDTGYAEGGGVGNWLSEHVVQPVKSALTPKPGIPASPSSTALGTGYARNTADTVKTHNQAVTDAAKGYAEGGMPDNQFIPVEKQPIVAPHGAEGSFELPPPKPGIPAPAATTPPPGPAAPPPPAAPAMGIAPDPNGSAQIGKKNVNYSDIGVMGKDPLAAKSTGSVNTMTGEEFQRSGLAADPNFGKPGMEYNTDTKTWGKPDPTIMVGNPHGIQSTMKESEAFNKGLMSPQQRESYQNRLQSERQAELTAQQTGTEIGLKKAETDLAQTRAKALSEGGSGAPSAYKDVRNSEIAKLNAEGITDPAERNQRILAAEIDFKKKSSTASSRITQALDIKTGKVVPITGEDIKNNPGQYISASDPDVKSVTGITKSMDQIGAFSKGVAKSFDLVDRLSDDYSKRKIPVVNKFSQYLSYHAGDTNIKAFQNALTTAMVEYMKVTNAGSGIGAAELTIEGQKRAAALLSTADSPATIKNAISVMKKEMEIKNNAFVGQRNEIFGRLGVAAPGIPAGQGAAPAVQEVTATNPQTGHKIKSTDGGNTWVDAQTGAPLR